jgi:GTPase SAR1 family protein
VADRFTAYFSAVHRVVVVGSGGAGKTTFAGSLQSGWTRRSFIATWLDAAIDRHRDHLRVVDLV